MNRLKHLGFSKWKKKIFIPKMTEMLEKALKGEFDAATSKNTIKEKEVKDKE